MLRILFTDAAVVDTSNLIKQLEHEVDARLKSRPTEPDDTTKTTKWAEPLPPINVSLVTDQSNRDDVDAVAKNTEREETNASGNS